MKSSFCTLHVRRKVAIAVFVLTCISYVAHGASRRQPPINTYGAPVLDAKRQHINYNRKTLEAMARAAAPKRAIDAVVKGTSTAGRSGFLPATPADQQPFWTYSIFGSGVGASNIVIGPTPVGGGPPEILIGGSARGDFWGNDFWHSIRYNATTGSYDNVFVSPIYTPEDYSRRISRIGLADVVGDSNLEIVVMIESGRIYLVDFATKAELGYFNTGVSDLQGLSLTDLDGDGKAELIITTMDNLYVFNGAGQLLWQVPGAGGYDVVAGQMDRDPALEIATTSGKVVDAVTHTVQWTRGGGFGYLLRLAPFPGETYKQLIAAPVGGVFSFDVSRQLPRWSIPVDISVDALDVADVDNDGVPEVIYGDDQWGAVHVHDLITQSEKWYANNPEHGITSIAVRDVDGDGIVDLLWGAGYSSTGSDYLYVANTTGSHNIKWQSVDLQGPFLGPVIGDLDGDGQSELVLCSVSSEADYDSGRILVFDLASLALRGISAPVVNNVSWTGVRDLKLRDVDGNGRMEIVIAADNLYDGAIEIYRFDANNTFTRTWTNSTRPDAEFDFVEVADIDGNGIRKIIGGCGNAYVYMYDYPSGAQSWQSVNLAGGPVYGLVVQDLDGNGSKEIAALVASNNGDLYTWDGPSRQLRNLRQSTGFTMLGTQLTPARLIGGDNAGVGHFLEYGRDRYTEPFTRQLASGSLNGVNPGNGGALWTGNGSVLNLRLAPSFNAVVWQSPAIGGSSGRFVATDFRNEQNRVFASAQHAAVGLTYTVPAPTVISAVSTKNHGVAGSFDVQLPLSGTPGIECRTGGSTNDYEVVVTFANSVAVNGTPQAQVTSGSSTIGSGGASNGGAVTTSGNSVTVPLTNVANAQTIQITLFGVSDGSGSGNVIVPMSVLIGDTNANGMVNSADVAQTKARVGQALDATNFRSDVNVSGGINSTDVATIKSNIGQGLP